MKKNFIVLISIISCMLFCGCVSNKSLMNTPVTAEPDVGKKESPTYELVVLHTNDLHGHPLKFYNYPAPDVAGLPAISTFVKEIHSEHQNVLVADAGDMNTGRPESSFFKAEPCREEDIPYPMYLKTL
jgi:2',3'-cyclic-nucleotide 2'-phosphodiesterase (5'-nucleotidase family)